MSSDTVIRVESLSKRYRLGQIGGTTLREDVSRWWARMRGLPDPTLKVTEVDRRSGARGQKSEIGGRKSEAGTPPATDPGSSPTSAVRSPTSGGAFAPPPSALRPPTSPDRGSARSDYVWALKDVSFEVKRGEVLGIIGRNGAGKSTLLKILSRITAPTDGRVKVRGRIASLLEIGTGMHPELTGRENIYLNGAILGMTKAEIAGKLDEIIAFSGVERYIDTPVKRYSSGMMVRLGFAVAAHLEPEILIVDEVLAVGDAEFQKKCLGKMQDIAGHGRTVLFVSHNMAAVTALCGRSLVFTDGVLSFDGDVFEAEALYLRAGESSSGYVHVLTGVVDISDVSAQYSETSTTECRIDIRLVLGGTGSVDDLYFDIGVENSRGTRVIQLIPSARGMPPVRVAEGAVLTYNVALLTTPLAPGRYTATLYAHSKARGVLMHRSDVRLFEVPTRPSTPECQSPGYTAVLSPHFTYAVHCSPP